MLKRASGVTRNQYERNTWFYGGAALAVTAVALDALAHYKGWASKRSDFATACAVGAGLLMMRHGSGRSEVQQVEQPPVPATPKKALVHHDTPMPGFHSPGRFSAVTPTFFSPPTTDTRPSPLTPLLQSPPAAVTPVYTRGRAPTLEGRIATDRAGLIEEIISAWSRNQLLAMSDEERQLLFDENFEARWACLQVYQLEHQQGDELTMDTVYSEVGELGLLYASDRLIRLWRRKVRPLVATECNFNQVRYLLQRLPGEELLYTFDRDVNGVPDVQTAKCAWVGQHADGQRLTLADLEANRCRGALRYLPAARQVELLRKHPDIRSELSISDEIIELFRGTRKGMANYLASRERPGDWGVEADPTVHLYVRNHLPIRDREELEVALQDPDFDAAQMRKRLVRTAEGDPPNKKSWKDYAVADIAKSQLDPKDQARLLWADGADLKRFLEYASDEQALTYLTITAKREYAMELARNPSNYSQAVFKALGQGKRFEQYRALENPSQQAAIEFIRGLERPDLWRASELNLEGMLSTQAIDILKEMEGAIRPTIGQYDQEIRQAVQAYQKESHQEIDDSLEFGDPIPSLDSLYQRHEEKIQDIMDRQNIAIAKAARPFLDRLAKLPSEE